MGVWAERSRCEEGPVGVGSLMEPEMLGEAGRAPVDGAGQPRRRRRTAEVHSVSRGRAHGSLSCEG